MAAGMASKRGRGRPSGTSKTTQVERQLLAHNVAKKELREANKQQAQAVKHAKQAKQQKEALKDANLE